MNGGSGPVKKQEQNSAPIDAATLILLRDADDGLEILLMRRHQNQEFMGGYFVFPGGILELADCELGLWENHCRPVSGEPNLLLQEPGLPAATARGLFVAAIRETFEECGVLLALSDNGTALDSNDAGTAVRFKEHRARLHKGNVSLADIAQGEGIRFAPDMMLPYAHWITPTNQPRRFDTRFFLALHPEGQQATHDEGELTEAIWVKPTNALHLNETGKMPLSPPTLKTVEELTAFRSAQQLWAATVKREIFPVLPQPCCENGCLTVKLPSDPQYTIEGFKRAPQPGECSRIVRKDGIWSIVREHG